MLHEVLKSRKPKNVSAEDVRTEYMQYLSAGSTHRYQMAEDWQFYNGNQLTTQQKEFLIAIGNPPEPNNKIRPAVQQVLANVAANAPEWRVTMATPTDYDMAWVLTKLMEQIWYESDGDVHFRQLTEHFIVKGLGYFYVYPDWLAEGGLGHLRLMFVPAEAMFIDPNVVSPFFDDAASMIYSDLDTKDHLKTVFPNWADLIEAAQPDGYTNEIQTGSLYSRDDIQMRATTQALGYMKPGIRKFVRFSKVSLPVARITDPDTGFTKVFTDEEYHEVTKDPGFKRLVSTGALIEDVGWETRIREVLVIGSEKVYDEIFPIREYPVVPAVNGHLRNPYPAGDVRHAKPPQRMLNRSEQYLIAYTDAVSNMKIGYEEGAVEPAELSQFNVPGTALIKFNPGRLKDGVHEFGAHQAPAELFHQKARYERDIEQIFGAYQFQQGDPKGGPGTVGEAQIVDEASARKQNWKMLPLYDLLTRVGKIALQWIPFVYDQQRVLNIVNPDGDMEEITVNRPVVDDRTGAVARMYNLTDFSADIRVVTGSTRARSPLARLQKDVMLLGAKVYDRLQVIMNIEEPIDKKSLIKRLSEIENLQGQLQQAGERIKQLEGDMQTRERELFHSTLRAEVAEATKSVQKAASDLKAAAKVQTSKIKQGAEAEA